MNSSPNRNRIIRSGSHCACCSLWVTRVADGRKEVAYRKAPHRIGNPHHGQVKPKGQHAYRKGWVP